MNITILYFASLREALGVEREIIELPDSVATLGNLRDWLVARGGDWSALNNGRVRAALNQSLALPDAAIAAGDEVAFFPPVTGG